MRVGEFTVISPRSNMKNTFIESICGHITSIDEKFSYSSLEINNQLSLRFYGIKIDKEELDIAWDLLTPKILGHIFLFNWDDVQTLKTIEKMLDHLSVSSSAPIMVIANMNGDTNRSYPVELFEPNGFVLDPSVRFTFCRISDTKCSKQAVASVVNILLDRLP